MSRRSLPGAPTIPTADRLVAPLAVFWAALTTVAFLGTLEVFFTQDDFWLLAAAESPMPNRAMIGGALLPDYVRPLTTYWLPLLNRAVWGLDAPAHHAVMLAILAAAVIALYIGLWRRFGSHAAACCGTAIYGLCEVHAFTLGWIAGANDVLCAAGFAAALMTMSPRAGEPRRGWHVALPFAIALLSKEHAIVLPAAFFGSVLLTGWLARRGDGPRVQRADRNLLIWFAAIGIGYAGLWLALTAGGGGAGRAFAFDPTRTAQVLRDSLLVVHPTIDCGDHISSAWLLLPPLMAAVSVVLLGRRAVADALFALLLWLLPAGIFALTSRPADLQEYYAHFSVFGLALLTAQVAAAVRQRTHGALRIGTVALLFAAAISHALTSLPRRLADIEHRRSPALHMARLSAAADEQIRAALAKYPTTRQIQFLDTTEVMWWAMGKGYMIPILYHGVTASFDGFEGVSLPPNASSGATTLVLRQVAPRTFDVVR